MDVETQPRGMRKQRADETRARLFAAAIELFRKHGYHSTSIDKIAARAGVAKGTFFVHYPSKDAVISELVRLQTDAAHLARAEALSAGKGPLSALRVAVMTLAEWASKSRSLSRGVLSAALESQDAGGEASTLFDSVFAEMCVDARAAKAAGLFLSHVDPDTFAQQLMASYLGAVLYFTTNPRSPSLVAVLEPLVDASLVGVLRSPAPGKSGIGAKSAKKKKAQ